MSGVKKSSGSRPPSRDLLENLRRLDRAVHHEVVSMLAEVGFPEIRIPHLRILLYTREESGTRMSYLAERLQLTPGAVTQLVAHLEQHGLVERVPDPRDKRAVLVRPTARTRPGYAASRARVAEIVTAMQEVVGKDRWEVFTAVLGEVVLVQERRVAGVAATSVRGTAGGTLGTGRELEGE